MVLGLHFTTMIFRLRMLAAGRTRNEPIEELEAVW